MGVKNPAIFNLDSRQCELTPYSNPDHRTREFDREPFEKELQN